MKYPKNPDTQPTSRRRWALITLAALAGVCVCTLVQQHRATATAEAGNARPSLRETSRKTAATDPEVKRMEKLAKLGATALQVAGADAAGPSVADLVPEREWIGSGWKTDPEPAVRSFAEWTGTYLALPADQRQALEEKGEELAKDRRTFLAEQISTDPRRALADAIPLAVREQLPTAVQAQLESRVNGYGDLYTLNTVPQPGGAAVAPFDYATIGGESYEAFRYGNRTTTPYVNGASIHGVSLDGKLAVLDSPVRTLETGERLTGATLNTYCPVSEETISSPGQGAIAANEKTVFQVGTDLYGTCEPAHVMNVETAIVSGEQKAQNTERTLTNHDLQALYKKSTSPGDRIQASGDSGVDGSTGYIGKPPTSLTHGGKNVLIMRVQPTDKPFPAAATVASFNTMVTGTDGWDARVRRTSYDKAWINRADVTPVMNLPQASSYYVPGGTSYNWGRWTDDSKAAAATAGYNLADYSCFVVAHDTYGAFGPGWGGGGMIWCNGNFDVRLMMHEYGHVFWLPHANSWSSTDGNPISPARVHREYGDNNDPMGYCWGVNARNTYNAYYKNICGWLPDTAVQTITRSGTYRVYQDDGGTALTRTLALKLGRDFEFNYWISIRGEAIAQPNFNNGVAVMAVSSYRQSDSKVLDMNNPGDSNTDNAPLALNQTWYDAAADVTIKTTAVGGTNPDRYADVQITFGPKNKGGYRPLVSGGVYRFKNRHNGQYLDVPGNSAADGVSVGVAAASGTASQNWVAWRGADGSYTFNHQGTDKWLNVVGNGMGDGVDITQATAVATDAQKWFIAQTAITQLVFVHRGSSGKAIDMAPSTLNISQWGYGENAWQQWYPELVAIIPGTYRLLPRHAHYQSLNISGGSTADGAQAIIYQNGTYAYEKWEVSNPTGSWLRLTPTHAVSKALDVNGAFATDGTKIQQWDWNNSPAQHWAISRMDGNWLRFTPECASSSCLDVTGTDDQTIDGTNVRLWQFTGTFDQQWRFADTN